MVSAPADAPFARPSSSSSPVAEPCAAPSRRSNLRGVRWRMDLGILPSSPDASIEDIRRVAADSRRRYASLRRRLLIDPHMYKDGDKSPGLVMDNPLSQSPDSMWGRFFQNAELEKMVDHDSSSKVFFACDRKCNYLPPKALAVDANILTHMGTVSHRNKSRHIRSCSLSSASVSPEPPLYSLRESSYWEEKWRVLYGTEEVQKERQTEPITKRILKKTFNRRRFSLSRTESDSSASKNMGAKEDNNHTTFRRRLFDDLSRDDDSGIGNIKFGCGGISDLPGTRDSVSVETVVEQDFSGASPVQTTLEKNLDCLGEERCFSEESFSVFATASIPPSRTSDQENDSEKSSVTSNSCNGDNVYEDYTAEDSFCNSSNNVVLGDCDNNSVAILNQGPNTDVKEKQQSPVTKEKKLLFGKFQWFWKFSRGVSEGNMEKGNVETRISTLTGNIQKDISEASSISCGSTSEPEVGDRKPINTLRDLGQSMRENIQVLESAFQQEQWEAGRENLSNNVLVEKTLKELRKISNRLCEM